MRRRKNEHAYIYQMSLRIARIRMDLALHSNQKVLGLPARGFSLFANKKLPYDERCRFDLYLETAAEARAVRGAKEPLAAFKKFFPDSARVVTKKIPRSIFKKIALAKDVVPARAAFAFGMQSVFVYDPVARRGIGVRAYSTRESVEALYQSVRSVLEVILPHMQGCIFHAAAATIASRACVFLGGKKAGKSTMCHIAVPDYVFGEERCVIRRMAGAYHCFTTPWWVRKKKSLSALARHQVVRGIFFLHKTQQRTRLSPVTMPRALKKILAEEEAGQLEYFFLDRESKKKMVMFYADLFRAVPSYDLFVRKGPSFAKSFRRQFPVAGCVRGSLP